MKNLIAELLFKLAQKEEESKELCAQVEALEIIVTEIRHSSQVVGCSSHIRVVCPGYFFVRVLPLCLWQENITNMKI